MASLNSLFITIPPATTQRRVRAAATAAKKSGGKTDPEEKGLLDFILGSLTKQDQFYETDPILRKVEDEKASGRGTTNGRGTTSSRGTTSGRRNTVVVPPKKSEGGGGFGGLAGLFAKKD